MAKSISDQAAALELARPYAELASELAKGMKQVKSLQSKLETAKGGVWGAFKRALAIGLASSHTVSNIKAGLAVACEESKIPSGSYRGYIGTIAHMYGEVLAQTLTLEECENMSIADARKRYRKEKTEPADVAGAAEDSNAAVAAVPETAEDKARAEIMARIASWDLAELTLLADMLDDIEASMVQEQREAA